MPRLRTRGDIKAQARFHADYDATPSSFASEAELDIEYDQSVADLWQLLVDADPERYSTTTTITTASGETSYVVPDDFMNLVAVWRMRGNDRYWVCRFDEMGRTQGPGLPDLLLDHGPPVRVVGQGVDGSASRLEFDYAPGPGISYEVRYNPAPPFTTDDGDQLDGVAGWEQWVVYDLAVKLKNREEGDPSALMAERARLEARIADLAIKRFIGRAHYIKDTRHASRRRRWRPR